VDADRMTDWSRLVRPPLVGLDPYSPGPGIDQLQTVYGFDEVVKLDWNEGLLGPFPGVREAVAAELERAWMYPEQSFADFRDAVAGWIGTTPNRIVPGHGIQALIGTVASAFLTPGDSVVVTRPTYGLYAQVSAAAGADVVRVPARDDLTHDLDALAEAATGTEARLVWLCDPNNPTGSLVEGSEWASFLDRLPGRCAVVVDEAYVEYVDPERRLRREEDVAVGRPVIVLRTFSKIFGLAGLRLGYAVVDESLAPFFDVVQEPFNVNRAGLAAGRASLARVDLVEERRKTNAAVRDWFAGLLREQGMEPQRSHANFLLVGVGVDDLELTARLARRGVLVRPGNDFGLQGFVRVTIGPEPLMERAAAALARAREDVSATKAAS
jgi:histidinol-phosphate aminotransferase